jgi:membrane peptidoglycan carboxypeptidase
VFVLVIGVAAVLVALLLLPLFGAAGLGANALNDRLQAAGASFRMPHFPERSTIYAADGSVLATIYLDENRVIVPLSRIAPVAQKAVVAIEDDKFYEHGAVNVPSILRAVIANVVAGHITQGGSTISQQLVKNAVIGSDEQTFARKFREAAYAIRREREYTKDEILEMYLNEIYFGNGIYGIGTAARYYFNEAASKLTLPQAALLAGMIRRPGDFDPVLHYDAALARRNLVLERLGNLGWVPQAEVDRAKALPITISAKAGKTTTKVRPFFVHYIVESILADADGEYDSFGQDYEQRRHTLFQGGLKIYTTLWPSWQREGEVAIDTSSSISMTEGPDSSLVSVIPQTGAIRAMVSGKDYERDQLDLAWHGLRQVGSAFKPFTLAAAFEDGFPPGKVYNSASPFCSSHWLSKDHCVSNAEGGGGGYINLWQATQNSVNVVFAQLALDVGPEKIVDVAHRMGITAPLDAVPAITLGVEEVSTLDMASAYGTLANEGVHCRPFAIARVMLPDGKKLYQHKAQCTQAIPGDIAHQITAMLQRVVCCGTGTAANIGRPVAGKTGTSQDYTNVYFAGYTPQVATAVWVGFPQGQVPMNAYYGHSVFGGTVAAPIWHAFMSTVTAGMPVESFPAPPPQPSGTVPDVVGMKSEEAQAALAAANFTPIVEEVDSSAKKGTVISQTPAGGTGATLGSGVTIQVSKGNREPVPVPSVVGMNQRYAVAVLKQAGLKAEVVYVGVTDPAQEGIVLSQTPVANKKVDTGTIVTIQVGKIGASPAPSPSPSPTSSPRPTPSPTPTPTPLPKG